MYAMRTLRNFKTNQCCHLTSRIANRAFYLNDEEKTRFVERLWLVAKFPGIEVLAYCFMSNHFHLLVYVPDPRELASGPRRPAELRAALGIASANFFTARYLTPLAKLGYIPVAGGEKNRYLPGSSIGFCARERRWSVPNPTTFTPPLWSDPRSP